VVHADRLPVFPRARELAAAEVIPGGTRRNLEAAAGVTWGPRVTPADRLLATDAQTSGGLLLAVPPDQLVSLLAGLEREGTAASAPIGELIAGPAGTLIVERG
jgi:selenide,water dikinase